MAHDVRDRSPHSSAIVNIAFDRKTFATRCLNLLRNGLQRLLSAARDSNLRAFRGKRQRASPSDSRSSTSDKRRFSRKSWHRRASPPV
jgi:hypothetical protein